jgi:hypothetical protein
MTPTPNSQPPTPDQDTATILADLRAEIRRRRERLGASGPLQGEPGSAAWSLNELRKSLDEVNDLWFVSAHLPMTWNSPVGHVLAYAKRLARLLLRWYINPIVEQQNLYNSAVARTLVELTAYADRQTRDWQALEERIAALEGQAPADALAPQPENRAQ